MSTIFEQDEFKPLQDRWNTRIQELNRRKSYYDGSVYRDMFAGLGWLTRWVMPRLYHGIKPLYLPLSRAVDVDAGIIPGGWELQPEAPEIWQPAIDTVFEWSRWNTDGVLFIHYGAIHGTVGLKVSDLRDQNIVVIKPCDPTTFLLIEAGQYETTPAMAIQVEQRRDQFGEPFEYAEVITPGEIRTYMDGQLAEFDEREAVYRNELGFVPFVEVDHIRTGEPLGQATYQLVIPILNELNELASYLSDIVKKHSEPQWAVFNAKAQDLEKSGDNVWFFDRENSRIEALLATVDIPGMLSFLQEIRSQVEAGLPELSFDELRSKDQIATATVQLQLMELTLKIQRSRPNYDAGLAAALQMAGRAAATMGLSDVSILDDPALQFDPDREIIPLDPETRIRLKMSQINLERAESGEPITGALNGRGNITPAAGRDATTDG